ncbi:MAG: putative beta-lysine N-acetyltransferase [Lentisphaeria bacterium]
MTTNITTEPIDKVANLAGATIQHGPCNRRVYLMKLGKAKPQIVLPQVLELCRKHRYSKVFAKVPARHEKTFHDMGFETEARVPRFFKNQEDAAFLGLYLDVKRREPKKPQEIQKIRRLSRSMSKKAPAVPPEDLLIRRCQPQDIPAMASIYSRVFESYPFPISEPDFLQETMASNVIYFGVWKNDKLVAVSSAETDREEQNAEMTDFATLPESRGGGFARILLTRMESAMRKEGITTTYTIARAISPAMNITFAKQGYEFAGCLVNNTNICGTIESMNIWYRNL